jgi:NADH-quinone oxidoreductase subunit G
MERAQGLFENDRALPFHVSSDNPLLRIHYNEDLDDKKAHKLLHTRYEARRLIKQDDFVLSEAQEEKKLKLTICLGRSCFLSGAQELFGSLMNYLRYAGLFANTEFKASFCAEICGRGPVLEVNGEILEHCTFQDAVEAINRSVK